MTSPDLRNGVILGLTTLGVILLAAAAREDPMAATEIVGVGCFVLATVYAQVTRGGR